MMRKIHVLPLLGILAIINTKCTKPEELPAAANHEINSFFDGSGKSGWVFTVTDSINYVAATYENSAYALNYIGDFSSAVDIETTFEIVVKSNQSRILNIEFTENIREEEYKFHTRNELVSVANTLLATNTISPNNFILLSNLVDDFMDNLKSNSNEKYFQRFEFKGFNFSYSIVKMMNRAIESNSTICKCNTPGIYFQEDAAFMCTQDIVLKSSAVESFYYNLDTVVFKKEIYGVDTSLLDTLSNITQPYITYEELTQIITSLPNGSNGTDSTSSAIFGLCGLFGWQGSDIGCCGNYGGGCWYCHVGCLAHDLMCWCCDSGAVPCGSGCQTEAGC